MTKNECMGQIAEMFPDLLEYLKKETYRLTGSGAIDLESEPPETFGMAKNILAVALENAADQYTPPNWDRTRWRHIKTLCRL